MAAPTNSPSELLCCSWRWSFTSLPRAPAGDTAVSQLWLLPGGDPVTGPIWSPVALPGREARRFFLYRQVAVLREQIGELTGAVVALEVGDQALEQVDTA
jgi:hypothetical protein